MRGNPFSTSLLGYCQGSIPAYAGEPNWGKQMAQALPVYPRVCGGTRRFNAPARNAGGLSPRMRGNLQIQRAVIAAAGSIPAYAGEPDGETAARCYYGSIPAYAGEPSAPWPAEICITVYPRVCGGTYIHIAAPPQP